MLALMLKRNKQSNTLSGIMKKTLMSINFCDTFRRWKNLDMGYPLIHDVPSCMKEWGSSRPTSMRLSTITESTSIRRVML